MEKIIPKYHYFTVAQKYEVNIFGEWVLFRVSRSSSGKYFFLEGRGNIITYSKEDFLKAVRNGYIKPTT